MEARTVSRAMASATSLAVALDLPVDVALVIDNSNKLALRLLPCDVFARVALAGQEVSALEVQLAQQLAATGSPVAALDPRVEARVYEDDGLAMTFCGSPRVGDFRRAPVSRLRRRAAPPACGHAKR